MPTTEINKTALYTKVMDTYGRARQFNKTCEELFELGTAIHHYQDGKVTVSDVASEIADVEVLLEQIKRELGCDDYVKLCKYQKLKRLAVKVGFKL